MIVNFDEFNNIPSVFYYQSNDLKDQPYLWKKENEDCTAAKPSCENNM